MANTLYNLALEYNLGDKIKNEFVDKIKFINYLLENLGQGSHSIALQPLKDKFGGKKGMSSKNKKEADKIIKESLKLTSVPVFPQPQPFMGMNPMALPLPMGPYGFPQQPQPQFNQQFANPMRGINGPCFSCQQTGHVARNCPNGQRSFRGGRNNRRGGGNGGRGNSGGRFFGKKKG